MLLSRPPHLIGSTLVLLVAAALRLFALDRLPPGLFYDESANGVDALRVLGGWHPVFFPGDQGREPLFIYLQAVTLALIGPSPLALRLPSAALGVLTVAATDATFRSFAGRRVGLLGASLLAVSFWHLSLSRLAFRTIALPFFSILAAFWLGKGIRSGRAEHFAVAGGLVGLDLYTYIPARLVPALVALWFFGCLAIPTWRGPTTPRRLLLGSGIALVSGALVALPLARYFVLHPHDFVERIQNAAGPVPVRTPLQGFLRAAEGLFLSGDPNVRHGLPGRPLIDVPVAILGLLGLALAGRRWRDGSSIFALVWCLAMLAPAAPTDEPAHALRLAGVLPFLLLFPALALDWLGRTLIREKRLVDPALLGAVLILGGGISARDYFGVWAARPDTYDVFQADLLHSLDLLAQIPPHQIVFATTDVYDGEPVPVSFVPRVRAQVQAFDGQNVFVVPPGPVDPVYYLYAHSFEPPGGPPLAGQSLTPVGVSHDPFGRVDGELYRVDPPIALPLPERPARAVIAAAVEVTGVDLQPVVRPGEASRVALHWTVRGRLPVGTWEFFAHLVDRRDQRLWAEDYNRGFPSDQWRPGDQVVSWFTLPVAADAPAAVADVHFGIFDRATGRRLDLATPAGEPAGNALRVGPVRVDRPRDVPPPRQVLLVHFGSAITLLGYDLARADAGGLRLGLHWRADGSVDDDWTVFVHLLDPQGRVAVGSDSQPGEGAYPTSTWLPGETFLDVHTLAATSEQIRTGRLEVGLYRLTTGERLPAIAGDGQPLGDALLLPISAESK